MSTGGSFSPLSFVMSPTCTISGNRSLVTSMGNFSISLAQSVLIPNRCAARGNPPIPSKSEPSVELCSRLFKIGGLFHVHLFEFFSHAVGKWAEQYAVVSVVCHAAIAWVTARKPQNCGLSLFVLQIPFVRFSHDPFSPFCSFWVGGGTRPPPFVKIAVSYSSHSSVFNRHRIPTSPSSERAAQCGDAFRAGVSLSVLHADILFSRCE